jgi:hypothetical protein
MISGQTLRVCPEEKPVSTFPDHALTRHSHPAILPLYGHRAAGGKARSART